MGRILEALRQIEDRAIHEETVPAAPAPDAEPREPVEEPSAVQIARVPLVPPVPLQDGAGRASGTQVLSRDGTGRASGTPRTRDPRWDDLAETILPLVAGQRRAVLLFTGAAGEDAPGSRLADLYAALAQQTPGGTVLVDCDTRRPGAARRPEPEVSLGLLDVLSGKATWRAAVCPGPCAGLSVLSSAVGPFEPARPVRPSDLATLADELRREYQLVILDGTLASPADVASLAGACEGAYLVVELGYTPRRAARETVRGIQQRGGRLLGCIVLEAA